MITALQSHKASVDQKRTCLVARLLEQVKPEERAALEAAIADVDHFTIEVLQRIFREHVSPVGRDTMRNHRRKICGCYDS